VTNVDEGKRIVRAAVFDDNDAVRDVLTMVLERRGPASARLPLPLERVSSDDH
jgi:hypothetical protein